jgi:hypothetical protein
MSKHERWEQKILLGEINLPPKKLNFIGIQQQNHSYQKKQLCGNNSTQPFVV